MYILVTSFPTFQPFCYHYEVVLISYLTPSQRTVPVIHAFEYPHVFNTILKKEKLYEQFFKMYSMFVNPSFNTPANVGDFS